MRQLLTREDVHAACLGGGVFAAGGGGWLDHGLQNGHTAVTLGRPTLVSIDEVPADGIIVTVSAIGAPAAPDWQMYPRDYIDEPVVGVMTAQNGYSTSINGWLQSAMLGVPVIDAAGDVRAHPTIRMGSMGLTSLPGYQTIQVAVGGNRDLNAYLEVVVRGSIMHTSQVMRAASVASGGFIAAARNPIPAAYVQEHAALGAVSLAINLGHAMLAAEAAGGQAVIAAIVQTLNGVILGTGTIRDLQLETRGGFDHAQFVVATDNAPLTIYILNEHMAVNANGARVSSYPDLIAVLSLETGHPISVKDTRPGQEVAILAVPYARLPLASGATDPAAFQEVAALMNIPLDPPAHSNGAG
jgi:hypothetical protein